MNICVFCSASELEDRYTEPAKRLAKMIAENGHTLVWGGSDRGLMRDIAAGVQAANGRIIGISMESLKHTARSNADEMIIARDLGHRKALFLERSDAIVALVGGTGTLDELTDIFELRRHGIHDKPIVVLNTDHFYDGLIKQYERMLEDGFLFQNMARPFNELISFVDTPEEVIATLQAEPSVQPAFAGRMVFSNEAI